MDKKYNIKATACRLKQVEHRKITYPFQGDICFVCLNVDVIN